MKAEIIQVLASFVGSFGFAVLYNLRGKKLCMAGISGMVSWIAYLIVWNEMPSTFVANLAAAAVATIYAETMARILKTPVTVFLITGIIPLVPGGNLYYTMNYVLAKQWHLFYLYGCDFPWIYYSGWNQCSKYFDNGNPWNSGHCDAVRTKYL